MLRASLCRASAAARPLARPHWRVVQRCYADSHRHSNSNSKPLGETAVPNPAPAVTPSPASRPPPKKKRRLRRLLVWLTLLSGLGYAGGVWYSLVSDNFHDFFTEYVPYGEDAVAYFEEREFRRRFPGRAGQPRLQPQTAGDHVTIPGRSGLTARLADDDDAAAAAAARSHSHSPLAATGPHTSAVADNNPPLASSTPPNPPTTHAHQDVVAPAPAPAPSPSPLDPVALPEAHDAVVHDVVKIVNDIITVINADTAHDARYNAALDKAKSDLARVVSDINLMKASLKRESEDAIRAAHAEFEQAAKELVQRLDHQMQAQEAHWKEEYENERERLSQTYKDRLRSELEAARQVYEQKTKNDLLEQSIRLQKSFTATVRDRVEAERQGRLGKLNELSSSVHELEKLTAEWNSVIDANLKTQHLVVAVEAVKSALDTQATPKPFVTELAALKEIAADDPVVSAAIASINPAAYQRGVASPALLIDRFRRVAAEVRKAALLPEDAGVASHMASLAMSKVLFKKSGLAVGQDVEAVLARTEVLLEEGDLDAAAREMNGLQGWAKVLSKDWLAECRRVLEVRQALDVIATEARLNSLLVD
ncbi:MICOS complex subunit mic60 [Pleosporales sp. CAS-2024a]